MLEGRIFQPEQVILGAESHKRPFTTKAQPRSEAPLCLHIHSVSLVSLITGMVLEEVRMWRVFDSSIALEME